ncbi:uncharacterized protein LOC104265623 [Ciona intestinalis]
MGLLKVSTILLCLISTCIGLTCYSCDNTSPNCIYPNSKTETKVCDDDTPCMYLTVETGIGNKTYRRDCLKFLHPNGCAALDPTQPDMMICSLECYTDLCNASITPTAKELVLVICSFLAIALQFL